MSDRRHHGFGADQDTNSSARAEQQYGELGTRRRNGLSISARSLGDLKGSTDRRGLERLPSIGEPRCTCWCEREVVDVTWDEIAEGRTRSCGRRLCDEIERRYVMATS